MPLRSEFLKARKTRNSKLKVETFFISSKNGVIVYIASARWTFKPSIIELSKNWIKQHHSHLFAIKSNLTFSHKYINLV